MQKVLEIIAGPNGSGKTTFAETALVKRKNSFYINSDKIAAGLTLNGNEYAQYEAGRFMLRQIEDCLINNRPFSFETTMSGRIWASHIKRAKKQGYKVIIYFVFVKTIELSLKRISNRVKNGGHNIPQDIVRRRFKRTFSNFVNLYAPLADEWYAIDNSINPTMIAHMKGKKKIILNEPIYQKYFA